jgi:hypothetical protein
MLASRGAVVKPARIARPSHAGQRYRKMALPGAAGLEYSGLAGEDDVESREGLFAFDFKPRTIAQLDQL